MADAIDRTWNQPHYGECPSCYSWLPIIYEVEAGSHGLRPVALQSIDTKPLYDVVNAARALIEAVEAGKAVADPLLAKPQIGKAMWNASMAKIEDGNRRTDEALAALKTALSKVAE